MDRREATIFLTMSSSSSAECKGSRRGVAKTANANAVERLHAAGFHVRRFAILAIVFRLKPHDLWTCK